jgi:hypothetical protein
MDAKTSFVRLIFGAPPVVHAEAEAKKPGMPLPQPALTR